MIRLVDISAQCCRSDAQLRDALAGLNATPHPFQVVLDEDGRVVGTLTDGDVRRALLAGMDLNASVARAMHTKAILGSVGDEANNSKLLRRIGATITFLPVVDGNRRLVEIWIATRTDDAPGLALVMAGGFGRRLGERTRQVPKPLLPIGGRPILDQVIDSVRLAGFRKIFVAVHYLADRIEQHLSSRPDDATLSTIREETPLGTAGAIALVPGREQENLLVINADLLTRVNLAALLTFHRHNDHDATIATANHETRSSFGVVRHDPGGRVQRIEEKPVMRNFVLTGIYYLAPSVTALVVPGQAQDMPEVINRACDAGMSVGMFPLHEYWRDIGEPTDLERAEYDNAALPQASIPRPPESVKKSS